MHSMTVGDGTFWHMANENPYPRTFFEKNKSSGQERNVLAFYYTEGKGEVTNGYVQFNLGDAFEESGERSFGGLGSADYFGRADIGDSGNPLFRESIKKVATNSSYPAENDDTKVLPHKRIRVKFLWSTITSNPLTCPCMRRAYCWQTRGLRNQRQSRIIMGTMTSTDWKSSTG